MNRLYLWDDASNLLVKKVIYKIHIPRMSVWNLKIRHNIRQRISSDRKNEVIMNRLPHRAPRSGSNGTITFMSLVDSIMDEIFFNL